MTDRFGVTLKVGDKVIVPFCRNPDDATLHEGKVSSIIEDEYTNKVFIDHEWTYERNIISLEIYREHRPEYFL